MRAAFLRFTFALWILGASAGAQHILKWERFNIYVDLENDGRVRVQETLEVFLNGKIVPLKYQLRSGDTNLTFVPHDVHRRKSSGGSLDHDTRKSACEAESSAAHSCRVDLP